MMNELNCLISSLKKEEGKKSLLRTKRGLLFLFATLVFWRTRGGLVLVRLEVVAARRGFAVVAYVTQYSRA